MNFPKKFLVFPIGWSDLGEINSEYVSEGLRNNHVHTFCNSNMHVGKEDGELFWFCPRCLIKMDNSVVQAYLKKKKA